MRRESCLSVERVRSVPRLVRYELHLVTASAPSNRNRCIQELASDSFAPEVLINYEVLDSCPRPSVTSEILKEEQIDRTDDTAAGLHHQQNSPLAVEYPLEGSTVGRCDRECRLILVHLRENSEHTRKIVRLGLTNEGLRTKLYPYGG